jgi:predicted dinucleotide-binding enzyme
MRLGVLGTGTVGRAIGARLVELGHDVMIGTRDLAKTLAVAEPDRMGNPPFKVWQQQHPKVKLETFSEAAAQGEMIVNATNGSASLDALRQAGEANLAGKVLIDISNALDSSKGMPPTLSDVQHRFDGRADSTRVPSGQSGQDPQHRQCVPDGGAGATRRRRSHHLLSGNDAAAKAKVADLLKSFGGKDILDLGDISTARGVEMYLPMWLRLWGSLQKPMFNVKVIR